MPKWVALAVFGGVLAAGPGRAQTAVTAQLHAMGTSGAPEFAGIGVGVGTRPSGRLGWMITAGGGAAGGEFAGRGELLATFHLDPRPSARVTLVASGGVAAAVLHGEVRELLVLNVGLEQRPRARRGWFAEVGVGGGVRIAVGVRWRWIGRGR